jgi:hypothetical protein
MMCQDLAISFFERYTYTVVTSIYRVVQRGTEEGLGFEIFKTVELLPLCFCVQIQPSLKVLNLLIIF